MVTDNERNRIEHDAVTARGAPTPPPRDTVYEPTTTEHVGTTPTVERDRFAVGERALTMPTAVNFSQDRIRWGPILAGFLAAMTTMILLSLLGLAIGTATWDPAATPGTAALPAEAGWASGIWGAVTGIISFLIGGYIAGRSAAIFSRGWGALNGALVFLLSVSFTLWLASMGLGGILGNLGTFAGTANIGQVEVTQAAQAIRDGATFTLIGMLLGLGAAALGGLLGTRRVENVDDTTYPATTTTGHVVH